MYNIEVFVNNPDNELVDDHMLCKDWGSTVQSSEIEYKVMIHLMTEIKIKWLRHKIKENEYNLVGEVIDVAVWGKYEITKIIEYLIRDLRK